MIVLNSGIGNYINLNNKRYSFFAGNNYLGLANHPVLIKAAKDAITKYGVNFSGSRQTTGTSELHLELEKLISEFKGKKDSVIFASGYMGNRIILQTLSGRYSALFIDEHSHPSIPDGIPSNIKDVFSYKHCDPGHLEILLKKNKKSRPLIISDGIFALTGEIAPLDKIYPLAEKYHAILVIDDAHSTGILGENGRGTPEYFNLGKFPDIYQSETMSKALGVYGGFISGDREIINEIREKSTAYMASTSLPPPLVAAGCSSMKILKKQPGLRIIALENAKLIREGVKSLNYKTSEDNTPIIPIFFSSQKKAIYLSEFLKDKGIIVPYVNYPVKIDKYIVRITASATHSNYQIEELLTALKKWRNKHAAGKD